MFFADLLIARPDQPGRELFQDQIQHALHLLGQLELSVPHACNGRIVLQSLAPLFSNELDEAGRAEQIEVIRSLTFPSHDCPLLNLKNRLAKAPAKEEWKSPELTKPRLKKADSTSTDGRLPGDVILQHPSGSIVTSLSLPDRGTSRESQSSTFDGEREHRDFEYEETVVDDERRGGNVGAVFHPRLHHVRPPQYSTVPILQSTPSTHPITFNSQPSNSENAHSLAQTRTAMSRQSSSNHFSPQGDGGGVHQIMVYPHQEVMPSTSIQPHYPIPPSAHSRPNTATSHLGLATVGMVQSAESSYAQSTGPEQLIETVHPMISPVQYQPHGEPYQHPSHVTNVQYDDHGAPMYTQVPNPPTYPYSPPSMRPLETGYQQPFEGMPSQNDSSGFGPPMQNGPGATSTYLPPPGHIPYHDRTQYAPPTHLPIAQHYSEPSDLGAKPPEGSMMTSQPYTDPQPHPNQFLNSQSRPWSGHEAYWS